MNNCNHSLLIYADQESKIKRTVEFLTEGIKQNEVIVLIDDETEEFRQNIEKHIENLRILEKEKNAFIFHSAEWYFSDGRFDSNDLSNKMLNIVKQAKKNQKVGIRIFGDKSEFFRHEHAEKFFECENLLESKFDLPVIAFCGYRSESIGNLSPENRGRLYDCHSNIFKEIPRIQNQLRRSKLQIYFDILVAINEAGSNTVQTRIQGKSNLSYDKFVKYLIELREKKLIQVDSLSLTDKGREFVKKFDSISSFLDRLGLDYL